jgi:hypothetical protein
VGLSSECRAYLGSQVLVEPVFGYGWRQQVPDSSGRYSEVEVPQPFHLIIDRFFDFKGELMGGLGTVVEPGHALDGLRVSFSARYQGAWDFLSRQSHYNLAVGSTERTTDNGWVLAVGLPALTGFGVIRDDAS